MGRLGLLQGGDPLLDRTQLRFLSHGACVFSRELGEEENPETDKMLLLQSRWLGGGRGQSLGAKK
jgi:hypothetical protein